MGLGDVIKIGGTIIGAGLAATGVLAPIGGAVVAASAGVAGGIADKIESDNREREANEKAEQAKKDAQNKLDQQKADADRLAKQTQDKLKKDADQAKLPGQVYTACANNNLDQVPGLLQKMTDKQFKDLGMSPVTQCTSAQAQQRIITMLNAERTRRGIT